MQITVVTIFPELFSPFLETSLVGKAGAEGRLEIQVRDLRDFTDDPHRQVDDEPFGGGAGMVMAAPPWLRAIRSLSGVETWRVLLSPQGERLDESTVRKLAARQDLLLLCGRYEGVDERVRMAAVDQEISIGDYVMAGGELPAMVLIEALSRQVPGVVGDPRSVEQDSFRSGLLDHPHYTRPRVVENMAVPEVLVSGDHAAIDRWRREQALVATFLKRPDLLRSARLSDSERELLEKVAEQERERAMVYADLSRRS